MIYSALTYQTLGPINLRKLKRIFSAQLLLALRAYDRQKRSLKTTICASWQLLNPFFISYQTKNKTKEFFLKIFCKTFDSFLLIICLIYDSSCNFLLNKPPRNILCQTFWALFVSFSMNAAYRKKTQKTNKFRLNSITLFLSVSFYWFSAIKYVDFFGWNKYRSLEPGEVISKKRCLSVARLIQFFLMLVSNMVKFSAFFSQ